MPTYPTVVLIVAVVTILGGCAEQQSKTLEELACLHTLGVSAFTRLADGSAGAPDVTDLQQIAAEESCRFLSGGPLRLVVGAGADEGVSLAVQIAEEDSGRTIAELRARFCVRGTLVSVTRSPTDGLALCVQDPALASNDPTAPARDLEQASYPAEELDRDIVWADGYYVLRPEGLGGHPIRERGRPAFGRQWKRVNGRRRGGREFKRQLGSSLRPRVRRDQCRVRRRSSRRCASGRRQR